MKQLAIVAVAAGLLVSAALSADPGAAKAPEKQDRPKVEVAFVLDTTGSMGGLIAAAKAKIWRIANQIVLGEPRPVVRFALVAYRDKPDNYVTKVFDLTDNIDQVYNDLMGFEANAGGDRPENVNQALYDAVHKIKWSPDRKTLKIIYLVGDSPPHNEYKDVPTYDKTAKAAIEKGIYINTVLCGGAADTGTIWREIAKAAEGTFIAIDASGGVKEIPTPYDGELSKLNAELTGTVVVFGSRAEQVKALRLNRTMAEIGASSEPAGEARAADRVAFSYASGKAGSRDLLEALADGKVKLAEVKKDEMPENMQKMSLPEQKAYVAKQQATRAEISKKIKDLAGKRNAFIKEKLAETKGGKDAFDTKVLETLKAQAARKNIKYE